MKYFPRFGRAGVSVLIAAGLAACSGGAGTIFSTAPQSHGRTAESLVGSAPVVTGVLLQPLTFTLSGTVGTVSLYGSAQCGSPTATNPCPGTTFTSATWDTMTPGLLATMGSSTLNTPCSAPAGAPAPAAGFTPGCYVVAYEGGASGPFLIQGPAAVNGNALVFQASPTTLSLDATIAYNFFLAYVTAIGPQPTPTPFNPVQPPNTPSPFATPVPTATPCTSTDDGHAGQRYGASKHRRRGGDDDCGDDD